MSVWDFVPSEVKEALVEGAKAWNQPGRDLLVLARHKSEGHWHVEPVNRVAFIREVSARLADLPDMAPCVQKLKAAKPCQYVWVLAIWEASWCLGHIEGHFSARAKEAAKRINSEGGKA